MGAVAEARTARDRQIRDGGGQRAHPALDVPDALRLHMRDEHQGGRRLEGRGAAIGGVAAEELTQARVAKILAERAPQGGEGLNAPEVAEPREPDPAAEFDRARPRAADERPLERPVHVARPAR